MAKIYYFDHKTSLLTSSPTIVSILEEYYRQKFKNNLISERSFTIYKSIILILKSNFPSIPIKDVQIRDIENFSDKIRTFSNETISKVWNSLKLAFRIAYSRRIIPYNIMQDEMLIKPNSNQFQSKTEALTIREQSKLINALNHELKTLDKYSTIIFAIFLCLYTGARIGEVLALCKDSVNLNNNTLTIKRTLTTNQNRRNLFK